MYPSMFMLWARQLPSWLMRRPMYPCSFSAFENLLCNSLSREQAEAFYSTSCVESGQLYFEIALCLLDKKRAARVDYQVIHAPVVIVVGSEDRCTVPRIARFTAEQYGGQSSCVVLEGADNMQTLQPYLVRHAFSNRRVAGQPGACSAFGEIQGGG